MKRPYDEAIDQHYAQVAAEQGLSATSTMADNTTRVKETEAILDFVEQSLLRRSASGFGGRATIVDVGCGNGLTIALLAEKYPDHDFLGVEKSEPLRRLADSRRAGLPNLTIAEGDIRQPGFLGEKCADILICQRVIINLLNLDDQNLALENVIDAVRSPAEGGPDGTMLFIEAFASALERLNAARSEFDLPAIPTAHHNLYLSDDFFRNPRLKPFEMNASVTPPNWLSTHYFVARVLHPVALQGRPFRRNSEFVSFLSEALPDAVGDYSPLKVFMFTKTG